MVKVDLTKLKEAVIKILQDFFVNPEDQKVKERAKEVYIKYMNLDPVLPRELAVAKNLLVDIAYDMGINPPTKKEAKEMIKKLQS